MCNAYKLRFYTLIFAVLLAIFATKYVHNFRRLRIKVLKLSLGFFNITTWRTNQTTGTLKKN